MASITLRPATQTDLPLIGQLCARSVAAPEEGIGYPRCEDETELLAELALYDSTLEDRVHMVCDASGEAVGFGGFLVADTDDRTYVVGPLLTDGHRDTETAAEVLRQLVSLPDCDGVNTVLNYPVVENTLLSEALRVTGWQPGTRSLEMRYETAAAQQAPSADSPIPLRDLTGPQDPRFTDVSELLARQHKWTTDPKERLANYLEDGYRTVVAETEGRLAACVLWIYVEDTDFARLDYLSVDEEFQRRSLGEALTRHVLADVHTSPGIEYVYLSLDPANDTAHRLYQRCGFADTVGSQQFSHVRG